MNEVLNAVREDPAKEIRHVMCVEVTDVDPEWQRRNCGVPFLRQLENRSDARVEVVRSP